MVEGMRLTTGGESFACRCGRRRHHYVQIIHHIVLVAFTTTVIDGQQRVGMDLEEVEEEGAQQGHY